jgi:hypothetical protein
MSIEMLYEKTNNFCFLLFSIEFTQIFLLYPTGDSYCWNKIDMKLDDSSGVRQFRHFFLAQQFFQLQHPK